MYKKFEKVHSLLTKKAYDAGRKEDWPRLERTVRLITTLRTIINGKRRVSFIRYK